MRAKQIYNPGVLARVRGELARARARQADASLALASAGLADWHPASSHPGSDLAAAAPFKRPGRPIGSPTTDTSPIWPARCTTISCSITRSTGTYEFSCEAYAGPWAESGLTHGGLAIMPFWVEGTGSISPVGQSERSNIPWRHTRLGDFNRLTVQASPTKVRYLVNGHLFYEDDDPSPTAPWLGLLTHRERHSVWRGLALSGQPAIPREVSLSDGDRLEGWVSAFYHETQPPRRTDSHDRPVGQCGVNRPRFSRDAARSAPRARGAGKKPRPPVNLDEYDWAAQGGVIHGRRVLPGSGSTPGNLRSIDGAAVGTEASQSVLSYFRPLNAGDVLSL